MSNATNLTMETINKIIATPEEFTSEVILKGIAQVNVIKKEAARLEKGLKESLESQSSAGDQLSLDFGDTHYSSEVSEKSSVKYSMTKASMIAFLDSIDSSYVDTEITKTINESKLLADKLASTLHPSIDAAVTVVTSKDLKVTATKIKKTGGSK